jgi:hypothetical protein
VPPLPVPTGVPRSIEGHWYRMALWLCPPVFRREHGDEMSRDFDEARGEAEARGSAALWTLRLLMAIDLVRTCGVQWLRTGLPAIALVSISIQVTVAEALARLARTATIPMPDKTAHTDADLMGVLLLATTTVLLIGMTIALTFWVTRLNRRRGRRR